MIIPLVIFSIVGISESFEAFIGSPLYQLESGIAPKDIVCRQDRVLVLRSNGDPACVKESTAKKMIQNNLITDILNSEETISPVILSEKKLIFDSTQQNLPISPGYSSPWATIELPEQVKLGVPFDVEYTWSYVLVDDETDEIVDIIEFDEHPGHVIGFTLQPEVELISSSEEFTKTTMTDSYGWDSHHYVKEEPFENTKIHNGKITLIFNEPVNFPNELFLMTVGDVQVSLYSKVDTEVVTFTDEAFGERLNSQSDPDYWQKNPHKVNYTYVANQWANYTSPDKNDLPLEVWDDLADFIRNYHPGVDVEQFLRQDGFSDEFIDKFLNNYPDEEISSTNVIEANNQFAFDFYSKVANGNEKNVFFSPWSISTAFAIAYEGAKGNTADEIRQVFEFPVDDKQRRTEFAAINDDLNEKDAKYKLQVANALWIAEGFEPLQEYVDTAKNYYDSEVSNVDFVSDAGVNKINKWAAEKTEGKIEKVLVPGSTDEFTRLFITNAIYFKGTWATQFNEESTHDDQFWIGPNENVKVPMMNLAATNFNYAKTAQLQILEMPYEGDKLSMLMLLPNDKDGLNELEKSLTNEKLNLWKDNLSQTKMVVSMPKFKLETNYNLKSLLENLGMPTAFKEGMADFTGITEDEPLHIGQAIHKAYVDVNEEGTEAAAVTGIGVITTSIPKYEIFKADHPFIFIIHEKETGNLLFIGRIVNPLA